MSESGSGEPVDSSTPTDKDFSCPSCSKQYSHSTTLTGHMRDCCPSELVQCPLCNNGFRTTTGMKTHYTRKHGGSIAGVEYECDYCGSKNRGKRAEVESGHSFCDRDCMAKFRSEQYSGEDHPRWNGGLVELKCEICGDTYKVKQTRSDKSKFCSSQCFGEYFSDEYSRENHYNWKGGISFYRGRNWKAQRQKARERDNHTCQLCGKTKEQNGQALSVHHKTPIREFVTNEECDYEQANALKNLVTLCNSCHAYVEHMAPLMPDGYLE